jgi:hypothetical protein
MKEVDCRQRSRCSETLAANASREVSSALRVMKLVWLGTADICFVSSPRCLLPLVLPALPALGEEVQDYCGPRPLMSAVDVSPFVQVRYGRR